MSFINAFQLAEFMQLAANPLVYNQDLHVANCRFNVDRFDDAWFIKENIDLPQRVKCSIPKRRAEYFVGRYLAKRCLAESGVHQFVLSADSNQCPLWPENLLGSISHSNDAAICIVARKNDYAAVGVDTENWVSAAAAENFCKTLMSPTERQRLETTGGGLKHFTHIFSAKESIFKALYPAVGRYFNFYAVELIDMDLSQNLLCFELTENLAAVYSKGVPLRVRFSESATGVTTLCLITAKDIV